MMVMVFCEDEKLLRRLLLGDGKKKGLNGGPVRLGDIETITKKDWPRVRSAVRNLNADWGCEVIRLTEKVEKGRVRTYYELNQDFIIGTNLDRVIIRKKGEE